MISKKTTDWNLDQCSTFEYNDKLFSFPANTTEKMSVCRISDVNFRQNLTLNVTGHLDLVIDHKHETDSNYHFYHQPSSSLNFLLAKSAPTSSHSLIFACKSTDIHSLKYRLSFNQLVIEINMTDNFMTHIFVDDPKNKLFNIKLIYNDNVHIVVYPEHMQTIYFGNGGGKFPKIPSLRKNYAFHSSILQLLKKVTN